MVTGRASDEFTFTEMLSTYVGASIKNLELFIQENHSRLQFGIVKHYYKHIQKYIIRQEILSFWLHRFIHIAG